MKIIIKYLIVLLCLSFNILNAQEVINQHKIKYFSFDPITKQFFYSVKKEYPNTNKKQIFNLINKWIIIYYPDTNLIYNRNFELGIIKLNMMYDVLLYNEYIGKHYSTFIVEISDNSVEYKIFDFRFKKRNKFSSDEESPFFNNKSQTLEEIVLDQKGSVKKDFREGFTLLEEKCFQTVEYLDNYIKSRILK
ncbi:MAG: hypothetical protein SFY32_01620 [Bacteroidota bacterium]|nr:hypothetical protein [Bacteroidota bacterium]